MNRIQKFGFIVMAVSVVAPIIVEVISHKITMAKPYDAELQSEIAADRWAKRIVLETIHNGGGYTDRRIDPSEDFEFYRIAYHFEK